MATVALATPLTASAAPDWVGDFESGDLSQWTLSPQVIGNADNMTVVEDVVAEGQYAGRIQVDPGDMSPSGHSRNELVYNPDAATFEGSERWYSFSLRPGDDAYADTWHLVYYWEGNPTFSAIMSFVVTGGQIQFRTFVGSETQHWVGAWTPGVWQDFILHVQWSPDPAVGFVELYVDGNQVVPMTNVATMFNSGEFNEMHTGLIRNSNITSTEVVYVDGVRAGATMEDVMGTDEPGTTSDGGTDETGDEPSDDSGTSDSPGGDTDPAGEDSATSNGDAAGGSGTATPGDGSGTAGDGGGAADGGDEGCSCHTGSGSPLPWMLGLFGLVALRRRRSA
ncbi:MAG: heparin lyase I family protein [Myxococcota bacterium]